MKMMIVANLKMNMRLDDLKSYIDKLNSCSFGNLSVVVCPTYVHVPFFAKKQFLLGSQDVSIHNYGAYTGEVSAQQLRELGVKYSLVGHSECRNNFNDTNDIINTKINNCNLAHINPIVCLGEEKQDKILGRTEQVLRREILDTFKNLNRECLNNVVIAYEPVWAISTGDIPSSTEIEKNISYIKSVFYSAYKINVPVLYGGSVNSKNIFNLVNIPNCDGFLLGDAASNINEFTNIISTLSEM